MRLRVGSLWLFWNFRLGDASEERLYDFEIVEGFISMGDDGCHGFVNCQQGRIWDTDFDYLISMLFDTVNNDVYFSEELGEVADDFLWFALKGYHL